MKAHLDGKTELYFLAKQLFLFSLQLIILLKLKLGLLGPIIGVSVLIPKILHRDCCNKPSILIYKADVITDFVIHGCSFVTLTLTLRVIVYLPLYTISQNIFMNSSVPVLPEERYCLPYRISFNRLCISVLMTSHYPLQIRRYKL